eukprot:3081301-Prymnesium_polylepis.1
MRSCPRIWLTKPTVTSPADSGSTPEKRSSDCDTPSQPSFAFRAAQSGTNARGPLLSTAGAAAGPLFRLPFGRNAAGGADGGLSGATLTERQISASQPCCTAAGRMHRGSDVIAAK